MLRLRMLYGLVLLSMLLWGGGAIYLLTPDSTETIESEPSNNLEMIEAATSIAPLTTELNSHFMPILAGFPSDPETDPQTYEKIRHDLRKTLAVIKSGQFTGPKWQAAVISLEKAMDAYLRRYERYFEQQPGPLERRDEFLKSLIARTQDLTDAASGIRAVAASRLQNRMNVNDQKSDRNTLLIMTLGLLGVIIAALVYSQLVTHFVNPVTSLRRSIHQLQGDAPATTGTGIFDDGREFNTIISAVNEMATELNMRRNHNHDDAAQRAEIIRGIIDAIPSPVFVLGDNGEVLQYNEQGGKLTESGNGGEKCLPAKIMRLVDNAKQSNSHYLPQDPRDSLLFRIDEEEIYYLPRIFHFDSKNAWLSGWVVLLHNVSRVRWMDDVKTNTIATVSHEIKTPLTGIRMVLLMLLEERSGPLNDVQRTLISSASGDCERLLLTLRSLLDISHKESGASNLNRVPLTFETSVRNAVKQFEESASSRRITFKVAGCDSDLPAILADPLRLDEVLNNLLSNAVRHSPDGGEIILRMSIPQAGYVRLTVIDQGSGVDEASQSRIFDRFFRVPGENGKGLGLGLFISRDIVTAHQGRIGLNERTDDRTEFFVDLPTA